MHCRNGGIFDGCKCRGCRLQEVARADDARRICKRHQMDINNEENRRLIEDGGKPRLTAAYLNSLGGFDDISTAATPGSSNGTAISETERLAASAYGKLPANERTELVAATARAYGFMKMIAARPPPPADTAPAAVPAKYPMPKCVASAKSAPPKSVASASVNPYMKAKPEAKAWVQDWALIQE